jgi:hypothetical protein
MTDARKITEAHIDRVGQLLAEVAGTLRWRAKNHDRSKFSPEEAGPLQAMQDLIDKEGPAPFGTDEYRQRTALLGPMLEHHYANNSHHPEHYPNGMSGYDLFDLVETFCDWKAASERGGDSAMGLTYCCQKYGIPPMLEAILRNTADRMGFKHV